ncbi:MAG: dienelactone hydrolase [Bradyrhizobium sp.]
MAGMPCETRQSVLRQIKGRVPNSKRETALYPYMKLPVGPECHFNWPDSEEFSVEFQRLLGAAQEGGSMVAECFLVLSRIDPQDHADSWHREWERMADLSHQRGNAAFERGHLPTAQGNWLRALNYYQASTFALDIADTKRQKAIEAMRACARRYIEHLSPAGEVVEIPWIEGHALEAYFLPAPASPARAPVVVCMGEPGHCKEEFLFKVTRHARERGVSLLVVDLLGPGDGAAFEDVVGRPDLETSVGSVMDYLTTRDDVDDQRVAIFGDGAGSSFVARGIALDYRYAAAVCDGGLWEMHERAFLNHRAGKAGGDGGRSRYHCPVLITVGEQGWLTRDVVIDLFERLRARQPGVSLKIFASEETAASQGHHDNPTLANEFIFDWIADRLDSART